MRIWLGWVGFSLQQNEVQELRLKAAKIFHKFIGVSV